MRVILKNENTANLLYDLCEKMQGIQFNDYKITGKGRKITIELIEHINVGDWVKIGNEYGRVKFVGKIYCEVEFRIVDERRYFNELCYFWHKNDIQKLNSIGVKRMENLCKKHMWF